MNRTRNQPPASGTSRVSGGAALRGGVTGPALLVSASGPTARAAQDATPDPGQPIPDSIAAVMEQPRYEEHTQWGIHVADQQTGEALLDLSCIQLNILGPMIKLFPAALTANGVDCRFETLDYRQSDISNGVLEGALILVARGHITVAGLNL